MTFYNVINYFSKSWISLISNDNKINDWDNLNLKYRIK